MTNSCCVNRLRRFRPRTENPRVGGSIPPLATIESITSGALALSGASDGTKTGPTASLPPLHLPHGELGQRDKARPSARLRLAQLAADRFQLPPHQQSTATELNIGPLQPEQFAQAQSTESKHRDGSAAERVRRP